MVSKSTGEGAQATQEAAGTTAKRARADAACDSRGGCSGEWSADLFGDRRGGNDVGWTSYACQ